MGDTAERNVRSDDHCKVGANRECREADHDAMPSFHCWGKLDAIGRGSVAARHRVPAMSCTTVKTAPTLICKTIGHRILLQACMCSPFQALVFPFLAYRRAEGVHIVRCRDTASEPKANGRVVVPSGCRL